MGKATNEDNIPFHEYELTAVAPADKEFELFINDKLPSDPEPSFYRWAL